MSRVASILGLLIALAAAAGAALIVSPAPTRMLALLAILAGERSLLIIAAALLASILAFLGSRPGTRLTSFFAIVLSLGAIVLALVPPAQALRVASEQRVDLSFGRYLRAAIDSQGPIKAERTATYATVGGRALGLDVYVPRGGTPAPAPAVLVVHGGGWSSGDRGDSSRFSEMLAQHGYVVFDVEYRTSPQPNGQAATGDVKCAIGWVKAHAAAADWQVDPKRITLLGRSAGGHLALLAAYTPGDPKLPPSCDAPDTTVESVIDYYGPTDLVWGYEHPGNPNVYDGRNRIEKLTGGTPSTQAALYHELSPIERITPQSPRTLLIHGGRDQFVAKAHAEMMSDKLRAAEVPFDFLLIPYAQHGFDFMFGGFSEQIAEAIALRFLEHKPR